MKINSVMIKNFRSYKGITNFDFRFKDDKNIILIGGENGAGKSSIFEAMKLCLYGPLTYKYQGMVTNYIVRVKAMINEDAYTDKNIESFIELDLDMTDRAVEKNYKIRRQWSFDGPKLIEEFIVVQNGQGLDEKESNDFYEYFKSEIPPSIFDLSFFDGEKLFDFFEDRISGSKLRDTMLTLNNFDILNILSRELVLNTRRKNREKKNLKNEIIELESIENELLSKKIYLDETKNKIYKTFNKIDKLTIDITNKNEEFINAGGLNQEDRDRLVHEISKCEIERDRINLEIKSFSNEILPFLMMMKELKEIEEQLYFEEDFMAYEIIKDRANVKTISNSLKNKNLYFENLDILIKEITDIIIPNKFDDDFKPIHYLSKEQSSNVISKINEIDNIDISDLNFFEDIKYLSEKIANSRAKLRNSMDMNEEKEYIKIIKEMNKELNETNIEGEKLLALKEKLEKEIEVEENKLIRINEKIDLIKKADNIKDMSDSIVEMTEALVTQITSSKRYDVAKRFNEIFSLIIRKDKFIDYIDIDDNFEVSLYVEKDYTVREIIQMIINLGMIGLREKLGYRFMEELMEEDRSMNRKDLLNKLNKLQDNKIIKLSTKIDIMNLSSGEKQIYILCLYWALVKSANISIPFIIDTPYARIDEKHRNAITTKFLPNISHQVIVLSTNTEIEEELYKEINRFISKEYTLDYDNNSRSTKVNKGYFYEVI